MGLRGRNRVPKASTQRRRLRFIFAGACCCSFCSSIRTQCFLYRLTNNRWLYETGWNDDGWWFVGYAKTLALRRLEILIHRRFLCFFLATSIQLSHFTTTTAAGTEIGSCLLGQQCSRIGKILRPSACTPRIRYRARTDSHDRQPFGQASPKVGQASDHPKGYIST